MLRVLTLSTLVPSEARPTFGVFVERQTLGLALRAGVEVEVVAPLGIPPWPLSRLPGYRNLSQQPLDEGWKGLRVHRPRFPILPRYGAQWNARSMARSLLPLLRDIRMRFEFDVIDAEFFWPDGPAAMHVSRSLGVPFSVMARGSDIQYWMSRPSVAAQIRAAANEAGGLLVASEALGRVMADRGLPADRMRVHYPGVDRQSFRLRNREEEKAKLGIEGPLLVTVGALIPGKGQREAIAAAERLPEATLLLAGEGPDRGALELMIRERRLEARVRLLGSRSPAEIAVLLSAADVMVLPTRSEGLANVWVEALTAGTPVVTSDVGGAREVIDRPEAGALVPPEAAAIAAAVQAILASPSDPARVRAAADKFDAHAEIDRLHEHLASIVADHKLADRAA
jgi:glycosyltransferase involved in cell wall biosynthesis